jgi:hypothetical protein
VDASAGPEAPALRQARCLTLLCQWPGPVEKKLKKALALQKTSATLPAPFRPMGDNGGNWRDRELIAPLGAGMMAVAAWCRIILILCLLNRLGR